MYKNPVPHPDDQDVAQHFYIVPFDFDKPQTIAEATLGINRLIRDNGGCIPSSWVRFAERPSVRFMQSQDKNV